MARGFDVVRRATVADDPRQIEDALRHASGQARLVVTTGGTGVGPRDVTPEATRAVCDRLLEGVAEMMRSEGRRETPMAVLSRGICGTRGTSLILNLPGNPAGAVSSLRAALPVLPHALELLSGKTEHESHGSHENSSNRTEPGPHAHAKRAAAASARGKVRRS